ncbi:hypothetical protein AMC99_00619 [Altererythrobacter epoxidivorans]|uniref:Uncharacterized protein n=1 Tax=Altererythrobacter epoxidivorans TaxID=361183 RepID=A0A0M4LT92_9SPHN|nr:hypothetical protein [Altererythrobacter epoxidivorans]ALE15929.1 hypothetical protein AMC99_00619 [Altererythrobacter epoxidivorans]
MYQSFEFYEARAKEAALEAEAATLENVRQRSLRAEKSWTGLAELALRLELERAKAKQSKAEKQDSEPDLQLLKLS